jgi:hypothetical protein
MKDRHLSDSEIQEYLLQENKLVADISEHLQECEICRSTAEQYKHIIEAVWRQEKAIFDFGLDELVMKQLPQKSEALSLKKSIIYSLLLVSFPVGALILFLLCTSLSVLLAGTLQIFVYLIITAVISLMLFQGFDSWYRFKKQMNILNSY